MEQPKKVDISVLCRFMVSYFIKNGIQFNPLKIQKVLYYIQAFHLVYFNKNFIFDEQPEAWVNGPVYRPIYDQYKSFGIYNLIGLKDNSEDRKESFYSKAKDAVDLSKEQWEFLDAILQHYGLMTHERLIFLTHSELPWNEARQGLGPFDYSSAKISFDTMYSFYSQESNKDKNG